MGNIDRNSKINRIEKCLSELLRRKLSLQFDVSLMIPIGVFQNLVWDNTIDSAEKLEQELIAFSHDGYKILHPYPTGVITRDYVLKVIKNINKEIEKGTPSYPSFPCMVESCYSDTSRNEFKGYRFTANREYYAAQRLDKLMQRYYRFFKKEDKSISASVFSILLQSSKQDLDKLLENYRSSYEPPVSDAQQVSFTSDHAIPVLNYLNEIAAANSRGTRYSMEEYCEKKKETTLHEYKKNIIEIKNQVTYRFRIHSADTENTDPSDNSNNNYFSIENNRDIAYYKMSKWAYLIHVYITNSFLESQISYLEKNIAGKETEYSVVELDAQKVWDFWHKSPKKNNSYHSEFAKAIEELNNTFLFAVRTTSSKIQKRFVLPDTSCDDEKFHIHRHFGKKQEITNISGDSLEVFPTYNSLYSIRRASNGKYYVYLRKQYAKMFSNPKLISTYPRELVDLSPKTNYSQIRLFEFLYTLSDSLINSTNKSIEISVSKLAIMVGKLDIADWKVNKHLGCVDPTDPNYADSIYIKIVRTNSFAYDLNRFFLQSNIKIFNKSLKDKDYEVSLIGNSDYPQIPNVQFSLVPRTKNLPQEDLPK